MESHDYHVERNPYDPEAAKPWLVENSLNCVVSRYETETEALDQMHELNRDALSDIS